MSRRRKLSTTISTDKLVNQLAREAGDFAALLYTWMIPHAEDNASITGDAEELFMTVVPGLRHKTDADVRDAVAVMDRLGLVAWDQEASVVYFDSESFYRHQSYIPEAKRADNSAHFLKRRASPQLSEEQRESAPISEEQREAAHKGASLSLSLSPSLSLEALPDADAPAGAINNDFEEWWAVYGRVGSKADAKMLYGWWRSKQGAGAEELTCAAVSYSAHCARDGSKQQYARTFLAKTPNRWREWADGEVHGSMDVKSTTRLNDVLAAGAIAFGITEDTDETAALGTGSGAGNLAAGPASRGSVPPFQLARRE